MNEIVPGETAILDHNVYRSRTNKKILNSIKSSLTQLTILFRTQIAEDHTVGSLHFNKYREIEENPEKRASPIDIKWSLNKISINHVRKQIADLLASSDLHEEEKKLYQISVDTYIANLRKQYKSHTQNNPYQRHYIDLYREKKISQENQYVAFALVNLLSRHPGAVDKEKGITEKGLKFLHKTLLETKSTYEKTGKGINKVFHDGDYMALLESQDHGSLQDYIDIIKYLLDKEGCNHYAEKSDKEGQKRRARNKSNFLDMRYSFHRIDFSKKDEIRDFHNLSVDIMKDIVAQRGGDMQVMERLKEESSAAIKLRGRTPNIWDHSGIRIMYYQDILDEQQIQEDIIEIMKEYFEFACMWAEDKKYEIQQITVQNKKTVTDQAHHEIIRTVNQEIAQYGIEAKTRLSNTTKDQFLSAEKLEAKIHRLEHEKEIPLLPDVKAAYADMTSTHVSRGENGGYKDYKRIINLKYTDDESGKEKTFWQEIQFYNYKNDTGMASHHILDLEKDIFAYCKSNQDMSLDTLRRKTSKTIKAMALQARRLKMEIPDLPEEAWTFTLDHGKKISLLDLLHDTTENEQAMKEVITYILNCFLHQRKLIHIYGDPRHAHSGDVYPQDLIHKKDTLKNRFTTSDVIKSAAFSKQIDDSKFISLYHEGKYLSVSVESLIDVIAAGYIPLAHRKQEKKEKRKPE